MILSDKILPLGIKWGDCYENGIPTEDVKEFIKELKEELKSYWDAEGYFVLAGVNERIDKLAGDTLVLSDEQGEQDEI